MCSCIKDPLASRCKISDKTKTEASRMLLKKEFSRHACASEENKMKHICGINVLIKALPVVKL
jgi:hypothetical protein